MSARTVLLYLYSHFQRKLSGTEPNKEQATTTDAPAKVQKRTTQLKRFYCMEGKCGYLKARALLFDLAGLKPDGPSNVLPEGRGIYLEADPKNTVLEMGDGTRLIKVGYVLGIIYKTNEEEIRWRVPNRIWGVITGETFHKLVAQHIRIIRSKPQGPPIVSSIPVHSNPETEANAAQQSRTNNW
jgi:hypothetical protein